jgi:hypothetical protein
MAKKARKTDVVGYLILVDGCKDWFKLCCAQRVAEREHTKEWSAIARWQFDVIPACQECGK